MNRRQLSKALAMTSIGFSLGIPQFFSSSQAEATETILTEDGLYSEPWFLESFLELQNDRLEANQNGKHFAIMWELKGCPYCKETHFVNFADKKINQYVQDNFEVLQLNYIGSRIVTDFDGEELSEKALARKYGVRFTPTFQFFPKGDHELASLKPKEREAVRFPGYMKPKHFNEMFKYVKQEEYLDKSFRKYLKLQSTY